MQINDFVVFWIGEGYDFAYNFLGDFERGRYVGALTFVGCNNLADWVRYLGSCRTYSGYRCLT